MPLTITCTPRLTLYRLGDRLGEAKIHHCLGVIAERQSRYAGALGHAEQALRLYQAIGDKASEATALNNIGMAHGLLGDYQQARAFGRQALALSEEVGHGWLKGFAWDSLGYAEHHLGNFAEANRCYQRSLSLCREVGDRFIEATTLTHLGDNYQAACDLPKPMTHGSRRWPSLTTCTPGGRATARQALRNAGCGRR